jgi:hypothetical protein
MNNQTLVAATIAVASLSGIWTENATADGFRVKPKTPEELANIETFYIKNLGRITQ